MGLGFDFRRSPLDYHPPLSWAKKRITPERKRQWNRKDHFQSNGCSKWRQIWRKWALETKENHSLTFSSDSCSQERHLDFLPPELLVYSLFDLEVPAEERGQMAEKLNSQHPPLDHQWEPGETLIYATSFPEQGSLFFPPPLNFCQTLSGQRTP